MTEKKVLVLTHFPSPYQVEFFNSIARCGRISLTVAYLYTYYPNRAWGMPKLFHAHFLINDDLQQLAELDASMEAADLAVFNYYQHSRTMKLIKRRAASGKAWCFWGERPGVRGFGMVGAFYRRLRFSVLHRSKAPIWGMGKWAVEGYRKEFGEGRLYFNVPYFSDLGRFKSMGKGNGRVGRCRTFLYSGSLIRRKGVDLLAEAFSRLAAEVPEVELKVVGDGDLRADMESQLSSCRDRVQFLGFQDWTQLPSFYLTSDVLCVPSRYDGWNLAVPEGLAAGLPVIGTDRVGAAIELIRHRENGWLIPADDVDALYEAMREAAELSSESLKRCLRAAEASAASYDTSAGVDRFHQAVDETLRQYAV